MLRLREFFFERRSIWDSFPVEMARQDASRLAHVKVETAPPPPWGRGQLLPPTALSADGSFRIMRDERDISTIFFPFVLLGHVNLFFVSPTRPLLSKWWFSAGALVGKKSFTSPRPE